MAGFLYYFPDVDPSQISPPFLKGRGVTLSLRDLFRNWQPSHNVIVTSIVHGPDGKCGCYVYPIPETGNLPRVNGYDSETQEWENHDGYWLGIDTENRPTPPELIRPTIVSGYEYRLGDDWDWICPIIREPNGTPNIPQSWGENGDGFAEKILPQWEWAWKLSEKIWNVFLGDEDMERAEAWDVCCQLLSINYRLGKHEITKLGLVTSENYVSIFQAAVDGALWKQYVEAESDEKKSGDSTPAIANSSDGTETQTVDTGQAGLQSA